MYVALVLTAAVVITLWRRSLHRTGVMLGVLGVVLCAAGGVWLLVRATAAMPRPIAEQPGLQNDIAVRLVAATEHWALFSKPDFTLVRVSLPGGAIVGTYDFGDEDVAFLCAAAIGDDALALTYVANTGDATENFWDAWALLGADGWRVAPGSRTEPAFAATWEPQSHTFLFTSEGRLASGAAGEEDVTEFSNLRVDPTGADVSRSAARAGRAAGHPRLLRGWPALRQWPARHRALSHHRLRPLRSAPTSRRARAWRRPGSWSSRLRLPGDRHRDGLVERAHHVDRPALHRRTSWLRRRAGLGVARTVAARRFAPATPRMDHRGPAQGGRGGRRLSLHRLPR